ncbi:MAG: acylphosphatase, partial [Bryobacteraceae bacterium]
MRSEARDIHIRGVVQGVGFRPHVFRLAREHALAGWVLNGDDGVRIHVEGAEDALDAFAGDLTAHPPPAARIVAIDVEPARVADLAGFEIRHSDSSGAPTTRIAPDLPVCDLCLREMLDPGDRHHRYPYINCTNCGPRYSIVRALPYDREHTTMAGWPLCSACAADYHDPDNRRFHAQPVACPACGPDYVLIRSDAVGQGIHPDARRDTFGEDAIRTAAQLLCDGRILAVKGVGGYHLACDADNAASV